MTCIVYNSTLVNQESQISDLRFLLFRQLTSSQITLSIKSDPYKTNEAPSYTIPDGETQTNNIYNTHQVAEDLYDKLCNVRKQTLTWEENNVYGNAGNPLYPTQDQHVYPTSEHHAGQHEASFIPGHESTINDPLYNFNTLRGPEDPYTMNTSQYVDHTREIYTLRNQPCVSDSQDCTQGAEGTTNPELDNIYIYEHRA